MSIRLLRVSLKWIWIRTGNSPQPRRVKWKGGSLKTDTKTLMGLRENTNLEKQIICMHHNDFRITLSSHSDSDWVNSLLKSMTLIFSPLWSLRFSFPRNSHRSEHTYYVSIPSSFYFHLLLRRGSGEPAESIDLCEVHGEWRLQSVGGDYVLFLQQRERLVSFNSREATAYEFRLRTDERDNLLKSTGKLKSSAIIQGKKKT